MKNKQLQQLLADYPDDAYIQIMCRDNETAQVIINPATYVFLDDSVDAATGITEVVISF